jgi:protease-4
MGSDTITSAFRAAIDDDDVKAIVFRVESPGGSYVASDTIRRETVRAREAGKPVVVSMGNLAGSGGYFVAMDADKIVAEPGTITASIGVLGGKMLTRRFWEDKLGVTWDDVHTSAHAQMWSSRHDYGPALERFNASLDRVYDDFTRKVAAGRELPLERVLEIAKGRIWTGEDAKALGLVDALGGVDVALDFAREAAGLEPGAPVRLKRFPPRRSTLQLLLSRGYKDPAGVASALAGIARQVQPGLDTLRHVGIGEPPGVLSMPEALPQP